MPDSQRLDTFIYLLMRDHLPTGTIAKLIMDIDELDVAEHQMISTLAFSNYHLKAMAEDYASRILENQSCCHGGIGGSTPIPGGQLPSG